MSDTTSTTSMEETVRRLFAATDEREAAGVVPYLTEDIELRFGNSDPVVGLADFTTMADQFNASLAGIRHDILDLWEIPGEEVVVARLNVHYERLDGGELDLPCCNVFRFRDGLVADYRIHMDINPVFAE